MHIFINSPAFAAVTEATDTAHEAKRETNRQSDEIAKLQRQLDKVSLASQAMWELLRDHAGVSDDQIVEKMQEIDLRDGSVDGKIGATIYDCPRCGRKTNSNRHNCIFCGNINEGGKPHVFE